MKNIDSNGFALIGVILVFLVIGALLSIGTRLIKPSAKRHLRIETIDTVKAAKDAVIGYAAANYELPSDTQFTSIARNPKDAYGKDLIYLYVNDLTSDVCGKKTTGFTGSSVSKTESDLAFLVLSGFDDYSVDSTDSGGAITISKSYTVADTATIPNTDRVEWVSLKELQILVGCAKSANSSRVIILNNSLPLGIEIWAYSTDIFADGGVPFTAGSGDYKWCWTSTAGLTDLALTCSGNLIKSTTCSLAAGTWRQCTSLGMSGTPGSNSSGTYNYTFYVKDADDNIDQKYLTLQVEQRGYPVYKVYNDAGARYDFIISETGGCKKIFNGNEIKDGAVRLNAGYFLERYSTNNNSCGGAVQGTLTFTEATLADIDSDGMVYFSGADM